MQKREYLAESEVGVDAIRAADFFVHFFGTITQESAKQFAVKLDATVNICGIV